VTGGPPAEPAQFAAEPGRFAAVLGSPIRHSLSPLLHRAAYAALGLSGWRYEAIECTEAELPTLLDSHPDAAGFSVTMPLKRAALRLADAADELAVRIGAGNTLLRRGSGWHAANTDWLGIRDALAESHTEKGSTVPGGNVARRAIVLGAGGTAQAALAALAGAAEIIVLVREPARATELLAAAERLPSPVRLGRLADLGRADFEPADLLISTLPPGAADDLVDQLVPGSALAPVRPVLAPGGAVLDVVYAGWPTPLARAAQRAGAPVISGAALLLHQAAWQVELMTGRAAPVEAMRAAMRAAVPDCGC
jgi:shikimate dehydrogenase